MFTIWVVTECYCIKDVVCVLSCSVTNIQNLIIFCSIESEAVGVQEKLSKLETQNGDLEADLEEEIMKNQVQSQSEVWPFEIRTF